ncbi:hypothetical protein [Muribaculum intestinale]|uniref:hypothetical protein n=1 Tax=Muribaculum intestinale TaxID=1796646 RepID=UPI00242C0CED|nr:hypothetical protein [Muribaculum intestinale]
MKKYVLHVVLIISLILNVVLLYKIIVPQVNDNLADKATNEFEDREYRIATAQNLIKNIICKDLYFPESYAPVSTSVDSVFHGPLTDAECLKAASELIKFKAQLPGAEDSYKEAVHTLKIFGSSGVFWRHAEEKKNAEERLNSLKSKIAKREDIIRQRDTSNDGKFIGWQVAHRYRAQTKGGDPSISDVLYILNPDMTSWMFRYSLDKTDSDNLNKLNKVIRQTLGMDYDEDE